VNVLFSKTYNLLLLESKVHFTPFSSCLLFTTEFWAESSYETTLI
jgi:hypothetical protein